MKKLKLCFAAVFAFAIIAASVFAFSAPARADEALKPVDVYLLMGQSNAAGFSSLSSGNSALTSEAMENVLVGGICQAYLSEAPSNFSKLTYESLVPTKKGLGKSDGFIGPEYGMAKVLASARVNVNGTGAQLYDKNNKAIIFKYATGASRLLNYVYETDMKMGTWYPRSRVNTASAGYVEGVTGELYNGAIRAFGTFAENLKKSGYQPVVKGIAWMQGEADREKAEEYRSVIQSFVSDLREDLTLITGVSAADAMFAMGEISETFYTATQRTTNRTFIKMQNEVAELESMQPAAIVETGDLPINLPESELADYGYTKSKLHKNGAYSDYVVGSDNCHWNANDMVLIGERFGATFISGYGGLTAKTSSSAGGTLFVDKTMFAAGDSLTFTVVPNTGYKLTGFTVNGGDKLGEVRDGKFMLENVAEAVTAEATFAAKSEFTIKITSEGLEKGKSGYLPNKSSKKVYEGDTAYVVTSAPDGKRVKSVTFNGNPMTYNENTERYEYQNVTESGTILITFEDSASAPDNDSSAADNIDKGEQTANEEKGGCGGKAAVAIASLFALVAAAFVIKG